MDTKKLRQKILDLAIRGKLVPQDPNDEPASVLLERIKAEKERLIKEGKIKRSKKTAKTSDTPHYQQILPEGWCITNIGELLINRDGERKPVSMAIRSKQINKVYDYYGAAGVIDKVDSYLFEERLLLVGEDGANLLSRNKNNAFLADGKYWVNNHAHVLDAIDKFILSYVAIVINSIKLDDYITGSAQPKLSQDNLNKIPIFLPPLDEQKRIMAELEQWFTIIDKIEQGKIDLQTTIKQAKSKILDLAIHGKLVSQDPNEEPAIELLKRINPEFTPCDNGHYTQLPFEVPQNWSWTTLGKIGKWQSGSTPNRLNKDYYNGNIPWLKTGDLNDGYITHIPEYITEKALNETSVKLNPTGSVLIAMYGATIGKIGILTFPATTNQACCACEVFNGIDREFIFLFLLSHREEFIKMGGGGAQPNISKEKIINTYIPLPPFMEQKRIINVVNKIFAQLDAIMESL
uniref:restriction endonuclease subunit S n=1 Tax=Phocaeicola plebeius TaxID=310297 RepID=UPI00359C8351